MSIRNYWTTPPIVDLVPSSPANNNNNNNSNTKEEELHFDDDCQSYGESYDSSSDGEPRRKTRRSRRGGYRRKRQQQKKVATLLADAATRRAQEQEITDCCDANSSQTTGSTTSVTDSESSSCESSTAGTPPRNIARKRVNNNIPTQSQPALNLAQQQQQLLQQQKQRGINCSNLLVAANAAHTRAYQNQPSTTMSMSRNRTRPACQTGRFLALDCEMVGVGKDGTQSALARVSILDWNGNVVMDEYIKPGRKVTDYRSFVSGITPEILFAKAKMDYATCRKKVINLLRHGTILVGHALENDLGILRINHPWHLIRDTAQYQPFMKVRAGALWPRRLQDLARERLHRDVQVYGRPHCPQEDALAALDLYKVAASDWENSILYTTQQFTMNAAAVAAQQHWMMMEQQQQQQHYQQRHRHHQQQHAQYAM